ncbi:hypothetical protein NAEGRDRAFT_31328 [Naegleria gruberi]|uniref:NADAR domain-containing protein n=1 Tax=Naegleria gruberi TaxID=5762 RepID=D2V5P0_NAEGR|nr:uncharacterized protein NAEGRDRAFT_31328 [Naegleria gruberi]EFC47831.1 hypothetical protein NAEGRDRAFT_31328 [Naegleria gruberi]|eukprot:XP_002680575.1 hypothetical protein NAEGRDRAFT_31328 [Naegleria gruberi strain NEG-M]
MPSQQQSKKPYDKFGNTQKYEFFWKDKSVFSNWHAASYVLDGIQFANTEQGMMYGKAKLFGDDEVAKDILANTSPSNAKQLGRMVSNFTDDMWNQNRELIMKRHLYAKFSQNEDIKQTLLSTGDKILAEASPNDAIWGIGMREHEAIETHPSKWPGLNLLGKLLTEVKQELRNQ